MTRTKDPMSHRDIESTVEPRRVLAALGFSETGEPARVTGGWDTLMWRFTTPDGREHSLRVYCLPRRDEVAWRERVALEACARAGLPAPRLETVGEFEGLPVAVLSWCPGRPLLSAVERRPWSIWHMTRLFGAAQARVHAVSPPAEFVEKAPDDWLCEVDEADADLADYVRGLQPTTTSLIHMDYHPLNVISDGAGITGIVDWAGAAAGDPRADLARTEFTMRTTPLPPGPLSPVLNLFRRLALRGWRSGYEEVAGPMPDIEPFLAWAGATLVCGMDLVLGRPGVWGTERDAERYRSEVDFWARQAGIR